MRKKSAPKSLMFVYTLHNRKYKSEKIFIVAHESCIANGVNQVIHEITNHIPATNARAKCNVCNELLDPIKARKEILAIGSLIKNAKNKPSEHS